MQASSTMTREVIVVPPELTLDAAYRIMQRRRIRHLPVVHGGKLLGILSDRDVLLASSLDDQSTVVVPRTAVGASMTPAPLTCDPDTSVADLARVMTERKIDAVPVVSASDRLVGLVTSTDLLLLLITREGARPLPFRFELHEHSGEAQA